MKLLEYIYCMIGMSQKHGNLLNAIYVAEINFFWLNKYNKKKIQKILKFSIHILTELRNA